MVCMSTVFSCTSTTAVCLTQKATRDVELFTLRTWCYVKDSKHIDESSTSLGELIDRTIYL